MSRGLSVIAKNIKKYRENLGITQDQLATSSGVTYNVLIKIESGATVNPTIKTAAKIAKGLRVTLDDLLKPSSFTGTLICKQCKKQYATAEEIWQCECGGLLELDFDTSFPIDEIKKRKQTMWRYREAIPIESDKHIVSFDEAITPLIKIPFGNHEVFVKQDHLFSSGSYKDRGAAVLISKVRELGVDKIVEDSLVEDSSGSASLAIASYCAHGDITCDLYTPPTVSKERLAQLQFFGAKIHTLSGSREEVSKKTLRVAQNEYYANHCWNPFFLHGIKTFAFEVWEQLGWRSPTTVIVPLGNGTLFLGIYMGFRELLNAGMITKIPKIIGIQSVNCAPLYLAYKKHLSKIPKVRKKATLAEGLAIIDPLRGEEIIEAVNNTNGEIITVHDDEIKQTLREMFRKGFAIEPTSAATIAGVKKYVVRCSEKETIVSAFTGSGLREIERIRRLLRSS